MIRRLVERVSRGVTLRRSMPARYGGGRIYVTPDSCLRYWLPNLDAIDPLLLKLVDQFVRAGDVVFDVGANVGLFAFAAASVAGPSGSVVALEADDWLAGLLRRSTAARADLGVAPVSVINAAAFSGYGLTRFAIAGRGRASNHIVGAGTSQAGRGREIRVVAAVPIDALLEQFGQPAVLKIDVEGAERQALAGATATLDHRPLVLCEVEAHNAEAVRDLFRSRDYLLFDGADASLQRSPIELPVFSTIACPRERIGLFASVREAR